MACIEQLRMLAPNHELHFLGFVTTESQDEVRVARTELESLCKAVHTVQLDLSKTAVLRAKLKFLTRLVPVDAELFASEEMQRQLQAQIASVRPDVVFAQFPQMAQYVTFCGSTATAMDVQDAFSVSGFRKFRSQTALTKKLGMFFNWISWLLYECRYYPMFDAVAAVTDQDRIGLEIFSPGLGADVIKASVSIDEIKEFEILPDSIGFIGSFSHYPNVEGIKHFIEKIFPLIRVRKPNARLRVAGGNPPQQLLDLAGPGIEFLGFVPDANAFMRSNAVMVVPLLSGGGVKIKTLHAMACACPIVTSSIGAEEIGVIDGTHALIADSATKFASQVLILLGDRPLAQRVAVAAKALVIQHFSWDAKLNSVERVLQRAFIRGQERIESDRSNFIG